MASPTTNPMVFPRPVFMNTTFVHDFRPSKACNMTYQPGSDTFKRVTLADDFIPAEHVIDDYPRS